MPEKINLQTGEYVFREGETADYAYHLDSGTVQIVKVSLDKNIVLSTIEKGTIFGEMALIDGQPRSASAIVTSDAVLTEVNSQSFLAYIQKNPTAALNIMKRISENLRFSNQKLLTAGQEETAAEVNLQSDTFWENIEEPFIGSIEDPDLIYNQKPNRVVLSAGFTIFAFIVLAAIFTSVFSIDMTVSSKGKFLTKVPNVEIQSANNSVIKNLKVSRGETVKKGQVIALLDGTIARSNLKANEEKLYSSEMKINRMTLEQKSIRTGKNITVGNSGLDPANEDILIKRLNQFRSKMISLNSKINKLTREVDFSRNNVELANRQLELKRQMEAAQEELYRQNISSMFKFLGSRDAALLAKKSYADAESKLEKSISELKSSEADKNEFYARWTSDLGEALAKEKENFVQLSESKVKLDREASDIEIRSPVDGIVLDLPSLGTGSIVKQGDKILTLVRLNVPLALEIDVDPKDISDVKVGTNVSVKLDALPFQEYGDIEGSLIYISDDTYTESLSGDQGSFYRGRVEIGVNEISKLPKDFRLTSGMTASADLLIGKRTIMSYLSRPFTKGFSKAFSEPD